MKLYVFHLESQAKAVERSAALLKKICDDRGWEGASISWKGEALDVVGPSDCAVVLAAPTAGSELGELWSEVSQRLGMAPILALTAPSPECESYCPGGRVVEIDGREERAKAALRSALRACDPHARGVFPDDSPTRDDQLKRKPVATALSRVLGQVWEIRADIRTYAQLMRATYLLYGLMVLIGALLISGLYSDYLLSYLPGVVIGQLLLWGRNRHEGDEGFQEISVTLTVMLIGSLAFISLIKIQLFPNDQWMHLLLPITLTLISGGLAIYAAQRVKSRLRQREQQYLTLRRPPDSWCPTRSAITASALVLAVTTLLGGAALLHGWVFDELAHLFYDTLGYFITAALPITAALGWPVLDCDEEGHDEAFVINLHGAWGSGKSSILEMLDASLGHGGDVVVLKYNAWKEASKQPVWWTLPEEFYRQAVRKRGLRWEEKASLSLTRQWWLATRVRGQYWGAILIAFTVAIVFWVGFYWIGDLLSLISGVDLGLDGTNSNTMRLMASLIGGIGTLASFSMRFKSGGGDPSQEFTNQSDDPMDEIKEHFKNMVRVTGRRVLILIDDLDRCEFERVVSVMNAVHTLFHTQPVVCVVAADSKWLRESYANHFKAKGGGNNDHHRMERIGEQFLEKLFQLQVRLPPLSEAVVDDYMEWIFDEWDVSDAKMGPGGDDRPGGGSSRENAKARFPSRAQLPNPSQRISEEQRKSRSSDISRLLESDNLYQTELAMARLSGVLPASTLDARRGALVRRPGQNLNLAELRDYVSLIARNPREVKRLINLVSYHKEYEKVRMASAAGALPNPQLIPWLILELRWPELARHLVRYPEDVDQLCPSGPCTTQEAPRAREASDVQSEEQTDNGREALLRRYGSDPEVSRVIWRYGVRQVSVGRLTAEEIRTIAERLYDQTDRAREEEWEPVAKSA